MHPAGGSGQDQIARPVPEDLLDVDPEDQGIGQIVDEILEPVLVGRRLGIEPLERLAASRGLGQRVRGGRLSLGGGGADLVTDRGHGFAELLEVLGQGVPGILHLAEQVVAIGEAARPHPREQATDLGGGQLGAVPAEIGGGGRGDPWADSLGGGHGFGR